VGQEAQIAVLLTRRELFARVAPRTVLSDLLGTTCDLDEGSKQLIMVPDHITVLPKTVTHKMAHAIRLMLLLAMVIDKYQCRLPR